MVEVPVEAPKGSREILRDVRGQLEVARVSNRYTSEQRSNALDVLRGVIRIMRHPYERCSYSGAGNCWCGREQSNTLHDVIVSEVRNG